ncbi:MAG: hypothetical protein J4G16_13895 [Acidobacteria bacterium]|nr:hypothetical protein [Acidobacteriota bacterium]
MKTSRFGVRGACTAVVLIGLACAGAAAQNPRAVLDRAVGDFAAGRLAAAAAGFDEVAALVPRAAPQLWQRGIALYYVGRYQDCREQFESHRLVNPNDVENAAWHFLCVARADSPAAALEALLPVGPDSRAPMREIYEMFRRELTPEEVLAAGERAAARGRGSGLFFAHLYVGLYHEALGNDADARVHLEAAADERYAPAGGYMHMVARVHVDHLDRAAPR